jgi:hypothetical protein
VLTNNLKKGDQVQLRNGWFAIMEDNMRGNIRVATVKGFFTEMGSIYMHDIARYFDKTTMTWKEDIELTETQKKAQITCR